MQLRLNLLQQNVKKQIKKFKILKKFKIILKFEFKYLIIDKF